MVGAFCYLPKEKSLHAGLSAQAQTITQSFTYTGQIVTWPVHAGINSLTIEARGAEGGPVGRFDPGKGARIVGTVSVTPGQTLSILVGQHPSLTNGGGGGSFVVGPGSGPGNPTPLVIAGGGGGSGVEDNSTTKQGQDVGVFGAGGNGTGPDSGTGGLGGNGGTSNDISSGGNVVGSGSGLLTDGTVGPRNGKAFINGGSGGDGGSGGFGGGGGGSTEYAGTSLPYVPNSGAGYTRGGGGGGYSGGGNGDGVGGGAGPTMRAPAQPTPPGLIRVMGW